MINYNDAKVWQRTWFLAMALGGGVGVAAWWWQLHAAAPSDEPADTKPSVALRPSEPHTASKPDSALLLPPQIMAHGRPSDVTPEDRAALKDAMSKTANPRSELERVVKYLRFQKGFEQWQSLQDSPDVATRHELAARLLTQIPDRLKQAELTMGEAWMLESALWADLEPDAAIRQQKLAQARAALNLAVPQQDAEQQAQDAAQLKEYKRREAAILADFQSKPDGQRDQAKLEQALEAARVAVFSRKN